MDNLLNRQKWIHMRQRTKTAPFSHRHTSEMENILPSDIWRFHILPCLDKCSRIELNRVLDPETRVVNRINARKFAKNVALASVHGILERAKIAKTDPQRVKAMLHFFMFLHTGFGRLLLKTPSILAIVWSKIDMVESDDPTAWWNKSPRYTPKLKKERQRLRDMLVANGHHV
jgi:hypothetical protein